MKKGFLSFLALITLVGIFISSASAEILTESFRQPDIRNDFCGNSIDFRYCKCAFHGDYCENIGQTESSANNRVQDGFTKFVGQKRSQFTNGCIDIMDIDAILDGDLCTRCVGEHFRINYQGSIRCATNEEMCGTDDPFLVWDIKNNKCVCTPGTELNKDSGMCEKEKIAEINFNWADQSPPFLADGTEGGIANLTVTALKGDKDLLEAKIELATSSRPGTLEVDDVEKNYSLTYKSPDLMNENPLKQYKDFLSITYKAKNSMAELEERTETIEIPLVIAIPITITSYGFEAKEGEEKKEIQFRGGDANVKVDGRYEDTVFVLQNTVIKVEGGGEFITDEEGEAEVATPNSKLKGETEDVKFELVLSADIVAKLRNTKKKYGETGITNETVATFLDDFPARLAHAEDNDAKKRLVDALKRIEYALFFIKEGQKFGAVSAKSLGTVTKDAAINVFDMLDTITGATGKISEYINAKGTNVGSRAKEIITEKLSTVRQEALKQMSAAFQAGLAKNAPKAGVWVGGLFKFLEDKLGGDTAKTGYAEAPLETWIADYFIKEQKKNSANQMNQIANMLNSGNFASLENSSDLDIAKDRYVAMADNYLKAEEGEYFSTMSKAWIDLGFDIVGKGISILTPYGKFVDGLEKAYKIGRTYFLDAPTMYGWYVTNGEILTTTEENINKSLGIKSVVSLIKSASLLNVFVPSAFAVTDNSLGGYMIASADSEFYKNWSEITFALAELFPDEEKGIRFYAEELKAKSANSKNIAAALMEEASEMIPVEEYGEWKIEKIKSTDVIKESSNNEDNSDSLYSKMLIILGFVGVFGIFILGRRFIFRKR